MVKTIKPTITVIDNIEWQLLVLGITLIIFMIVMLYFTRYYYNKNYKTTYVSNPQTSTNDITVTAGNLKSCEKPGYCIVNLESGLKTCPSNSKTTMFYDSDTQVCSPKTSCPSVLPYAVNGDGSVNRYGSCENNIPCMCTGNITCARYVVSKFSVTNGNIYSTNTSDKNFIMEQVPYNSGDSFNNSIKLNNSNEYCKINSTYSTTLVGGCSFTNQVNDFLMKCDKQDLGATSVSPYSLDPYYYNNGSDITKQFCEIQPYLDSNWNNMTLCVNQNPCKTGKYTYNYDKYRDIEVNNVSQLNTNIKNASLNSRNFCQSYSSDLTTYLTDLQYYTLSCINGISCNAIPNVLDSGKFFVGENNELDISAINASYNVTYANETIMLQQNVSNANTGATYNPFLNQIRSGDIIYNVTIDKYYIIRVNPINNAITLYYYTTNDFDLKIGGLDIHTKTVITLIKNQQQFGESDELKYFPQFGLNGFGYNTITNNPINLINPNIILDESNLPLCHKVSNIALSSYIPSQSILQTGTFYRANLSKPAGYVFKEFEQEVASLQDIDTSYNQKSFNAGNYKIKETQFDTRYYNDISFYSPVWNNQYGRTECVRCSPLLVASINMVKVSSTTDDTGFVYDAVTIQFSGQDFKHYRYNYLNETFQDRWIYESRTSLSKDIQSSVNKIYLERPNINIQNGDYILSTNSDFNFSIKPLTPISSKYINKNFAILMGDVYIENIEQDFRNYTPFLDTGNITDTSFEFFGLGVNDNTYQDYVDGAYIIAKYDGEQFVFSERVNTNIVNSGLKKNKKGFLYGNKYTALYVENPKLMPFLSIIFSKNARENMEIKGFEQDDLVVPVTLVPSVRVLDISDNKDIITTTGFNQIQPFDTTLLNPNVELQFISFQRTLYLDNNQEDINKSLSGSGGEISIQEITDGRITSIEVIRQGSGYSNISPLVRLESFDPYFI